MNKRYQKLVEKTLLITTIVLAAGSVAFAWTGTGAGALILAFFAGGAVLVCSAKTRAEKAGNSAKVMMMTMILAFVLPVLMFAVLSASLLTRVLFVAAGATMVLRMILLDMWIWQPLVRKWQALVDSRPN